MKCPKCQRPIDTTGLKPGAPVTCQCGNVVAVPKPGMSRTMLFIIIGAGLVVLACPCLGILSAIAIPNFVRFQARAKQAECNVNLKSLYMGLMTSAQDKQGSELTFSQIRFSPERGNRYSYFLGNGPMEDRSGPQPQGTEQARAIGADTLRFPTLRVYTLEDLPPEVASQVGIEGTCPECEFTVACAGDVDNNPNDTPDVWTVSNMDRTIDGQNVAAGQPYNHVNDVTLD
ncbi:MAG TPA: fimbrial protein [Hyalangium sp.]|nr:fimbrial protein [Hyalangium sp.]